MSWLRPEKSDGGVARVGFVVDAHMPSWDRCLKQKTIRPLLTGWPSNTPGTVMRFGWIASYVNHMDDRRVTYELYRPWRRYQAVVFVKSMDHACRKLASSLRRNGQRAVFDANVDYFTPVTGTEYFAGMSPTPQQREQSCAMAQACDGVIADSRYLLDRVAPYNPRAVWIPDNVPDQWIADTGGNVPESGKKLRLLWSGEAVKLFELLKIESVLRHFSDYIQLTIVTGDVKAFSRIHEPWQGRLHRLLADLDCELLPFRDIPGLLKVYDRGGVCVSPRFLDNSYNKGHTEWKISLAMARGCVALASPQPSYCDLAGRTAGGGVRICKDDEQWKTAFDSILAGEINWEEEQRQACLVVQWHYSTSVIATAHAQWITSLIAGNVEGELE